MATQVSDPAVTVNNVGVSVVPNSVEFDEGLGEQDVLNQSAGNGVSSTVFANDVETNVGMVKFSMRATPANIALARQWKANANQNVVSLSGITPEGNVNRTFTGAAITNNYTVTLSADGVLELEFKGNKPTT